MAGEQEHLIKNVSYHIDKIIIRGYNIPHRDISSLTILNKYYEYTTNNSLTDEALVIEGLIFDLKYSCGSLCK